MTPLVVVSTGKTEIGEPCSISVRAAGADMHLTATGPDPALENVTALVQGLAPDTIVAWVDGDDWIRPGALEFVRQAYSSDDVWCTWGSYETADGKRGISAPYFPGEDVRRVEWRASHLKTFRAGLFRAIPQSELQLQEAGPKVNGIIGKGPHWLSRAIDMAVMFPAIELAGLDRCRYLRDVIYVYNWHASFERNATVEEKRHERAVAQWIRNRPPLKRLESAPWR
jgi:hypothetical protein